MGDRGDYCSGDSMVVVAMVTVKFAMTVMVLVVLIVRVEG